MEKNSCLNESSKRTLLAATSHSNNTMSLITVCGSEMDVFSIIMLEGADATYMENVE